MPPRARKFLSYYRPYWRLFLADMLCAVVVSAIALTLPLCARYLTETVVVQAAPDVGLQIVAVGLLMLALLALHTACNSFIDYQGHMMGTRMEADMRRDLFDHFQKQPFTFYDERRTGQLMSRITSDLFSLSELYHHGPEDIAIALLKLLGVLAISLTINVQLTLLLLAFVPVMLLYALYFNRRMNAALLLWKERVAAVNEQVEDTLAGIRVVQSFANEPLEAEKFAGANQRFVESYRAAHRAEAFFYNGMMTFTQLMTIGVIIVGCFSIVAGPLSLPDLVTYLLYVGVLVEPVQRLTNFARLYQDGITGFMRFMDMLEMPPTIADAPHARALSDVRGAIAFEAVRFRYDADHTAVLDGVSLTVAAGETVALVGTSGVGKTTLCSLIPRFYEIEAGRITVDGHDIRDLTLRSLRQNIGLVQQDVYLFAGSVADNIRYGNGAASFDAIVAAAQHAHAHDFIMALPQGYDTDVGQRGVKLSGGQKQRLSIARVFLKNPPILILDEATSSLDNASERAVQAALEALSQNRTTLVIAHRLSTVRNADRILVLTENGISEDGTHDELLQAGGHYARLVQMQMALA